MLVERSLVLHAFILGMTFGGLIGMVIGLSFDLIIPLLNEVLKY